MNKDWNIIEVLRYARHDWLNKIQLIQGNLALNKMDRAKEIIHEIIDDAMQEAKLSNLNIPQFASLILTHNWENHLFQLKFDVMDGSKGDHLDDEWLTKWTVTFFEYVNASIKRFYDNQLSIIIEPQIEGTRFFFDFRGIITNMEHLEGFFKETATAPKITIHHLSDQEFSLELYLHK
ncbi:stage 0 sporulation protein B (sporulation initiation phosphotransferase) [Cytobacillus eiseniae]|uniref:Stage 0 sporulation protein B (Sporulation initiation phosphotransferase) n=1 Tax=Cytobacillus eiseniae TaxID=762947 RepID=A0ABS4RFK3_9BACI|nr:Spo0B C-terminal domain-containing protein [Cytobacillus eiseniae]MBP2240572.1 stage 0 sporulation protein B (sporulation initiation phosphotransferase) [Cytobacillus eiseniae]